MRKAQIQEDRKNNMTYRQIAEKHGVSKQYVGQICSQFNPKYFKVVQEDGCIYPNLRRWMNENKVSRYELLRRMGMFAAGMNCDVLRGIMRGEKSPRKEWIDKMLEATGMTYEELFRLEG